MALYGRCRSLASTLVNFRSFALEYERLYRTAINLPQNRPLNQAGQGEITMTFRRNISEALSGFHEFLEDEVYFE